MMAPRKFRDLPPALDPQPGDIFPISQIDPLSGAASTYGMRRDDFQADLIAQVNDARADLVAEFESRDIQLAAAVSDLQSHQTWIDNTIVQIEAIDTGLQSAIDALETKVDHPAQWSEIAGKPSTFQPSAHTHVKAEITDFPTTWAWNDITGKPSTFPASVSWADVTSKPSTFTPSAHMHVKADITDFVHTHPQSDVTGLVAALAGKIDGPLSIGSPNSLTPAFGTAYQATNPAKPGFISAMIDTAYTVTVASTLTDTVELRIGPNQAQVAAGTGGFVAATFRASLTGIALVVGLGLGQRNQLTAMLPVGWYWALRRVAGTAATITSATDQSLG